MACRTRPPVLRPTNQFPLQSTLDAGLLPPGTFAEFRRLAAELGALQRSDGLGIQVTVGASGRTNVAFGGQGGRLLQERLGLGTSPTEVLVPPSRAKPNPGEIKVTACSFPEVLTFLLRDVEPSMSHRDSGLVAACAEETRQLTGPLFRMRSSTSRPNDAFAAIGDRDHWFSVADADLKSKETFGLITRLFSLQASGSKGRNPLLTIPTG